MADFCDMVNNDVAEIVDRLSRENWCLVERS